MIRGTNSGITCLITPDGTVQGEMDPFVMGWKIWDVPVYERDTYGSTLYSRVSDVPMKVLSYVAYALLAAGAVLAFVRKKK